MCFSDCCLQEASLLAASAASSMGLRDFGGLESRCTQACCPLFTCLAITVTELLCKSTCLHCAPVKGEKNLCQIMAFRHSVSYQGVCLQLQLGLMLQQHGQSHYIWFALKLLLCLCIFSYSLPWRDKSKTKPPTKHMYSLGCVVDLLYFDHLLHKEKLKSASGFKDKSAYMLCDPGLCWLPNESVY